MSSLDIDAAWRTITRLKPYLAPIVGRSAVYATAMGIIVTSPRIGDAGSALGLAIVTALVATLVPARDQRDRLVLLALAIAGGTVLFIVEWVCVWRGQWAYPAEDSAPFIRHMNAMAGRVWACVPRFLSAAVELPHVGHASVPLWVWPCRVLVILAAYDVLRTTETLLSVSSSSSISDLPLERK